MNDDSAVKIMQSLGMNYKPAIDATKEFQGTIADLNKQLDTLKNKAIESAKGINDAFTINIGGKQIRDLHARMQKEAKPIEVKVITDKAERQMLEFAKSMKIKLDRNMKEQFTSLADSMLDPSVNKIWENRFNNLVKGITDAYIQAMNREERRLQETILKQTDEWKIYDALKRVTFDPSSYEVQLAKTDVEGFTNALRGLAKQSKQTGITLTDFEADLRSLGVQGMGETSDEIGASIVKAVEYIRKFRKGLVDLGTDVPREEIEQFVSESLSKLSASLASIKYESKQTSEELAKTSPTFSDKSVDALAGSYDKLGQSINKIGAINRKTWEDANGDIYKYTDTLKDLERNITIVDTYLKNEFGKYDYQGRTVDDRSVEMNYKSIQKAHEEALKMNVAFDDAIKKQHEMAKNEAWKQYFQNITNASDEIKKLNEYYTEMGGKQAKVFSEIDIAQMKSKAASVEQKLFSRGLTDEYHKQAGTLREQLAVIESRLRTEGKLTDEEMQQTMELEKQLNLLQAQSSETIFDDKAKQSTGFGEEMDRRFGWFLSGRVFYGTINAAKEARDTIKDVERGIIDVQRVMSDSSFVFDEYRDKLLQFGVDYGQTFDVVQDISMRWAQAGYNVRDSLELTETALVALNAAELNAETATQGLIAIMSQWNIEANDLINVIDRINITADNYSVTSQDLVDGLVRSSSAAKNFGMSLEDTISLLTVMREASGRTGQEVGNALNSILSYMQRTASLNTFERLGVKVFADEAKTEFRNVMEVFSELSDLWGSASNDIKDGFVAAAQEAGLFSEELAISMVGMDGYTDVVDSATEAQEKYVEGLSDVERRDAAQAAAGVFRRNYFIALIDRFAKSQDVLNNMMDSNGYTMEKNEITMESLEKKQQSLKASAEALAVAIGDAGLTGTLKALADSGTFVLNSINNLPKPIRDTTLAAMSMFTAVKVLEQGMKIFGLQVPNINNVIRNLTTSVDGLKLSLMYAKDGVTAFVAANAPLLALSAAVGVVIAFANAVKRQREETELLSEAFREQQEVYRDVSQEISILEDLAEKTSLTAEENEKLALTKERIIGLLPQSKSFLDDENLSLREQLEIIEDLNEAELERLRLEAQGVINAQKDSYEADKKKLEELRGEYDHWLEMLNEIQLKQAQILRGEGGELTHTEETWLKDLPGILENIEKKIKPLERDTKDYEDALESLNYVLEKTNDELGGPDGLVGNIDDATDAMDGLIEKFNDTTSVLQFYYQILDEIESKEGLSAKSKQEIINKHHELLPYLENEAEMREILLELITAQEDEQINSYNNILMSSDVYFNSLLSGNKQFYDALRDYYGTDLANVKSLAQAKLEIEKSLISTLGRIWAQYYSAAYQTMVFPDADTEQAFYGSAEGKRYLAGKRALYEINKIQGSIGSASGGFQDINMGGVKTPTGGSKGSSPSTSTQKPQYDYDKDLEALERFLIQYIKKRGELEKKALDDWYKAEIDTLEKIHKEKIDSYNKELNEFKSFVNDKIKIIQGEADEEDYLNDLRKEKEKAREIQKAIDRLALDDSTEARNKTAQLRQELAEQNEKIAEKEKNREKDIKIQALRDSIEIKETEVNNLIDRENESYNATKENLERTRDLKLAEHEKSYNDSKVYAEAKKAINRGLVKDFEGNMVSIKKAYIDFEDRYGRGMGILGKKTKDEFLASIDRVNLGLQGMHKEAGYVGTKTQSAMSQATKSIASARKAVQGLVDDYKKTSKEIESAMSQATKSIASARKAVQGLVDDYKKTSKEIESATKKLKGFSNQSVVVNKGGHVYRIVSKYAEGGIIDYTGPAWVDGSPAMPEYVLNTPQFKALGKYIAEAQSSIPDTIPLSDIRGVSQPSVQIGSFLTLYGDITKEAMPMVEKLSNNAMSKLKLELTKLGYQ